MMLNSIQSHLSLLLLSSGLFFASSENGRGVRLKKKKKSRLHCKCVCVFGCGCACVCVPVRSYGCSVWGVGEGKRGGGGEGVRDLFFCFFL